MNSGDRTKLIALYNKVKNGAPALEEIKCFMELTGTRCPDSPSFKSSLTEEEKARVRRCC